MKTICMLFLTLILLGVLLTSQAKVESENQPAYQAYEYEGDGNY